DDLTYYWYASNKIMQTNGGYAGKVLNGKYTSFYLTGNLKEKGIFKNGVKNGKWVAWYDDGKIKEISVWQKGLKKGYSKEFDTEGELISKVKYKNGKQNGYQIIYSDGKVSDKKKFRNGVEIVKKQDGDSKPKQ